MLLLVVERKPGVVMKNARIGAVLLNYPRWSKCSCVWYKTCAVSLKCRWNETEQRLSSISKLILKRLQLASYHTCERCQS